MMWVAVRQRFAKFLADLQITNTQREDGIGKHLNVGAALERAYYGANIHTAPPGLLVGSWGKATQVRPSNDVDSFFILPSAVKARFEFRSGNVQSQLLQDVRSTLLVSYPQTEVRGDGQVVVVAFNTLTLEIVPVFQNGAGFLMPDTRNDGVWKFVDPMAQISAINSADQSMNGNVRALAQIIKHWRNEKNVPLKSFVIELLVADFLPAYGNGFFDTYWYDYYVRDFLEFLCVRANQFIIIPGTGEHHSLGNDWLSRAITARGYAVKACQYEYVDNEVAAGEEWQKIFGSRIPIKVT